MERRRLTSRFEQLLRIEASSKTEMYADVLGSVDLASFSYWLEIIFAAGIATLGLVQDSPAVVIGAMLISPLMGPITAAGLALAVGDLYLGIKSLLMLFASIVVSIVFSASIVWAMPFQAATAEILARTQPNLLDLGVAVFSGLAGSIMFCRRSQGAALPGVAIAVALMPPLCTVGFGLGSGVQTQIMTGALLLFLTNLAAIIASAFLVFLGVGMNAPEVRDPIDASIRLRGSQDWLYALLRRTFLSSSLGDVGQLHWRILMLGIVIVALAVPLSRSLLQVRDETVARGAIQDAIRQLAPAESILSEYVHYSRESLRVRLVLTETVPASRIEEARRTVLRRTGRDIEFFVRQVAREDEIVSLRERLKPAPPTPLEDLASVRRELFGRLDASIREVWPAAQAELLDYDLAFGAEAILVRVSYRAKAELEDAAREMLQRVLRMRFRSETLQLVLAWTKEPAPRSGLPAPRR